jgi:hypothetical protein
MRRTRAALVTAVLSVSLLAGCGDDEESPDGGQQAPQTIEITFSGESVTPNGERVQVDAGEEVELVVKADEPGSLHVHSNPEQELEYGAGTTNLTLTIDEPGVVEVEAHDLEVVVVQLEVE